MIIKSIGNLTGGNAREVSATLATLFELAERWGCILLLDEADVYLSSRHSGDVKDNSLISGTRKAPPVQFNLLRALYL